MKKWLRELPSVHDIQQSNEFLQAKKRIGNQELVTDWVRQSIDKIREDLLSEQWHPSKLSKQAFMSYVFEVLQNKVNKFENNKLKRVINTTGTIIHTNLGRANLSEEAMNQVNLVAGSYSTLEYNIEEGKRGSRHDLIEDLIRQTTDAEAAMVVNNNAAAVYLVLKALAKDKEVIVSRGQLVEIGGSFRVSSIMEESGAKLIEVGTTNKTHPADYEQAMTEDTSMLMKVHTSNFRIVGFTQEVSLQELVEMKKSHPSVLVYEDLGSGALYDFASHGIGDEPTVKSTLKAGADVVTFSGDKLLGGPQAGIIAGKKEIIQRLKKHQLARVLRVDKMTLAALEATLKAYIRGDIQQLPVSRMVTESSEDVQQRATQFIEALKGSSWKLKQVGTEAQIGGGTMPEVRIPSIGIEVKNPLISTPALEKQLRLECDPPVVTRIQDDHLLLDFRTINREEVAELATNFQTIEKERLNEE